MKRFVNWLTPAPQVARHMCIRCDEVRDDVPGPWSRCTSCERIVMEIAEAHPDVYLAYVRSLEAARRGRHATP